MTVGQEVRIHARVRGVVQGVGFRAWARATATALEVRGWVRNDRDGSVELQAAGAPAAIDALRHRLRQGPPTARVEGLTELEGPFDLPGEGFEVRR